MFNRTYAEDFTEVWQLNNFPFSFDFLFLQWSLLNSAAKFQPSEKKHLGRKKDARKWTSQMAWKDYWTFGVLLCAFYALKCSSQIDFTVADTKVLRPWLQLLRIKSHAIFWFGHILYEESHRAIENTHFSWQLPIVRVISNCYWLVGKFWFWKSRGVSNRLRI